MAFHLYKRTQGKEGAWHYAQLGAVSLAGTTSGLVYPFVKRYAPAGAETFPWGATAKELLQEGGVAARDHTVVVDLKPKENVSLFELTDVWGYSYLDHTPLLLRMESLFVNEMPLDPERFKQSFSDKGCPRRPVHQFLSLQGGVVGGDWKWAPIGSVNGVLLWPDALEYFLSVLGEGIEDEDEA